MFKTDNLVFTELHKTGGTHITAILNELLGGETIGKHNRLTEKEDRLFKIASVRNPWDWYVSLWAYGCQGKGSVFLNTTRKHGPYFYLTQLPNEMGKQRLSFGEALTQFKHSKVKDTGAWGRLYQDSENPELFREWIKKVLSDEHKFEIGEGFGFSPISEKQGLMTYRFIKLLTHYTTDIYDNRKSQDYQSIKDFWERNKNTDFVIRNEHLEDDLANALMLSGFSDMDRYHSLLKDRFQKRTNSSKRHPAGFYYDPQTIELVRSKETLIIDLFDYQAPTI